MPNTTSQLTQPPPLATQKYGPAVSQRLPSPRTFLLWLFLLSLLRSSVSGHSVSSSSRRASTPTTTVSHHNPLSPANTDADGTLLSRRHATQALACRFGVVATCLLGQSISVGTWHPAPCEAAAPPPFFSNPFVAFETVDQIPREYFDQRRSIYAFVDKVIDGDTLRVHHIPGYRSWGLLGSDPPQPLTSRKLSDKTLLIRLYGVDAPETAKKGGSNPDPEGQPFGQEAKEFTASLVYHQMVRVTFLRKDQYQRAICQVETVPDASSSSAGLLSFLSWFPGLGPKDLSVELAAAGLAELYVGGGAEYNVSASLHDVEANGIQLPTCLCPVVTTRRLLTIIPLYCNVLISSRLSAEQP